MAKDWKAKTLVSSRPLSLVHQAGNPEFGMRARGCFTWLACVLIIVACTADSTTLPCSQDSRCLSYAIMADIPILDPHRTDIPEAGMIFRQIYDTLIYRDPATHEFLPGLASSWQVSDDGLAYTFNLRQDVRFHGGESFDAAAVASNIDRIFDPALPGSLARTLLGPLSQYEVLGEFAIRLHLFEANGAFLDAWSQPYLGIANPAALQRYGHLRYQFHQDGTGPYKLNDYLPGDRIKLERFDAYSVDRATQGSAGGGEFARVEFSLDVEAGAGTLSLLASAIDVVDDIAPLEAQNLSANSRVRIVPVAIPGQTVQFLFNTRRDHVNSRAVRQALLLATNRIAISNLVFLSFSPVAWAPLSESSGYAHTGYINQYAFDATEAQRLLAAAGYQDSDQDGILERLERPLALSIVVPPWGRLPEVADYLRREWRAIGIDLSIEPVPGRARLDSLIESGEYDLLPIDNYGIDPDLLSRVFLDSATYRASQAHNPALMNLLIAARQERDPILRRNLYYEIQALLMNEVLVLPIRENVRLTATRAEISDLGFDAFGFYPLLRDARISES